MRSSHARRTLALEAGRFIKQGKEHTLDICRAIARCHQLVVNLDIKRLLTDLSAPSPPASRNTPHIALHAITLTILLYRPMVIGDTLTHLSRYRKSAR